MARKRERLTRERFEFTAFYDDSDDRLHIHRTTVSEFQTQARPYWQVDGRETERDWLVLRRDEFLDLVQEGWGALSYQVRLVRAAGVRVDGSTETVYGTQPVPVREEGK
jgi:hypothetical protein